MSNIQSEKKDNNKVLIGIIIGLVVAISVAGYFIFSQKAEIDDLYQDSLLTKQELEDEYENLTMQYEEFRLNVKNDSLLERLSSEKAKVQSLLDELKTVKATNKQEINRLNKELNSLRKILKSYVAQIDSLNRANEKLKAENKEISNRYQSTQRNLQEVSKQKESLTEKVALAAKLDAIAISVQGTNSKGKVQKKINKIEQLIINFTLGKNITAEPGERTIYVRIMKPDDDVLTKSRANKFPFESGEINYSIKRIVEYGGEEVPVTLYWNVEEYLMPGTYRVDIFADGNRIGSKSFNLEG